MYQCCTIGISVFAALLLYVPVIADPTTTYDKKGGVILLHGMAGTASSMHDLETYLSNKPCTPRFFTCRAGLSRRSLGEGGSLDEGRPFHAPDDKLGIFNLP